MNVRYLYATVDTVYVFDDQLQLLQSQKLSESDVLQIAQQKVSKTEKILFESFSDAKVYFCNYKDQGFSNLIDLSILRKILSKVQPPNFSKTKTFAYAHVAQKLQEYVTWDLHVCQAVRTVDEIPKSITLFTIRVRVWF